ncbi:MAG TPA: M48 family metalloprotease [Methylomirabilota bacterium]
MPNQRPREMLARMSSTGAIQGPDCRMPTEKTSGAPAEARVLQRTPGGTAVPRRSGGAKPVSRDTLRGRASRRTGPGPPTMTSIHPRRRNALRRTASAALLLSVLTSCATNPVTGERELSLMSEEQEIAIGRETDAQVREEMGLYDDPALQAYVERVGQRLARTSERPDLPWHFAVVDEPVVNAFALPGGYIYLTRGIMAYLNDEAELAGVLGHEIGHVTARHAAQAYTRATGAQLGLTLGSIFFPEAQAYTQAAAAGLSLLFLKYGRDDELQADRLGVRYAASAGWDPTGVADMLRTLGRLNQISDPSGGIPSWLATHPEPAARVDEVLPLARELAAKRGQLAVDQADYLQQVDGVLYGPDPREGVIRGRQFLHPVLRFAVTYPSGWPVMNGKTQVVAQAPEQPAYAFLQLADLPAGDLDRAAVQWMANAGFQPVEGGLTDVNGLRAFAGTYAGAVEGLGRVGVLAAHVPHGNQVFMVAGLAAESRFNAYRNEFNAFIRSFRRLSAAEAGRVTPDRVTLYTTRQGDTWSGLAEQSGGAVTAQELAVINGSPPGDRLTAGRRIKLIRSTS